MADREDGALATSLMTFLLGVAVGAAVAILYAPQAGTETRAQIAEKAGQLKDKATELKETVTERAQEWKEKATAVIQRGAERIDSGDGGSESGRKLADANAGDSSA